MNKTKNIYSAIHMGSLSEESDEMIPLLSPEEEYEMSQDDNVADSIPILPVRNSVLFPGVVMPITVGRKKSIKLVKQAYKGDRMIGVITQQNSDAEDPAVEDLFSIGTIAKIIKILVLPDGNTTIIIQGKRRFRLLEIVEEVPYFKGKVGLLAENFPDIKKKQTKALMSSIKDVASKMIKMNPELPPEAKIAVDNIETPGFLTHFIVSNMNIDVKIKQSILETDDGFTRATALLEQMYKEMQVLELKHEINHKVHLDIDQQQRDYFLRQQMKVLQTELGEDGQDQEIEKIRLKSLKKKWPQYAKTYFEKELQKVQRMNPMSAEYPVQMNYLETMVDLPWDNYSKDNFNLKRARTILDKDHYGLEKVKERILEYLAVLKLKSLKTDGDISMRGPILCLYGPPGVGKTSLGRSIAKALNREYVRMALGGIRDEAEIRGHRKTYIGAMPGKIIHNLKKTGTSNPVFILDEIDKVANEFRGDPSSALLEVLDPEQNSTFVDNYIEIEYDLSKILFIATSNSLDTIQPALRDRMEIIEVNGYTVEEKYEIARRHLIPKLLEEHGLTKSDVVFSKSAVMKVIEGYSRESGVRGLERKLGAVVRNTAKSIAMEDPFDKTITDATVVKILGPEIYEYDDYVGNDTPGLVTGLAWTSVGGEILTIESILSRGKGRLTLSGQLGDVMKESATAALSNLKANADKLDIDYRVFEHFDLHIHVPAGAVPKDGPSAGITMMTSLASTYTQRRVKEKVAMTGEITLSGKVLPVGGIKEKLLAARRSGMKEVIMCYKNKKDVEDIKGDYLKDMTIHYVKTIEEVIELALLPEKVKNPMDLSIIEEKKIPADY